MIESGQTIKLTGFGDDLDGEHIVENVQNKNHLIQGTPEWHELRRNSIGASDAAVILGISPWKTRYRLWCEKLGAEQQEETYAMRRGSAMEPQALAAYEKHAGAQFFPEVVFHPKYPFIMASLDGLSLDGKRGVEIKCPGKETINQAKKGDVPQHYYAQLQHQMLCAGLRQMDYYCFDGEEGICITVEFDETFAASMLDEELAFWALVKAKTPPALTDQDYLIKEDDPDWFHHANRLRQIDEQLKALEDEKSYIKEMLIDKSEGRSCKGCGVTLTQSMRKGNVNYAKIPQLADVDLEAYRGKSVQIWTLRIN